MSKCVLFCGPRLSGKDTAIDYLINKGYDITKRECKDHLHKLVQTFFLISEERYWEIYDNRSLKEKPLPEFRVTFTSALELFYNVLKTKVDVNALERDCNNGMINLSIRESMIMVSELFAKRMKGLDYFGKALADSIQEDEFCGDASIGFKEELAPVIEKLGQENILLIRIRGRGSFESDSRSYIPDNVVDNTVDVWNNGSEQEFLEEVERIVSEFIDEEV